MMRAVSVALAAALVSATAIAQPWSGPFGIEKGLSRETLERDLKAEPTSSPVVLITTTAPTPNPLFQRYAFRFSEKSGLCNVMATTAAIEMNPFGTQAQAKFSEIREALISVYGPPAKDYNFVRAGSLWNEPRDWAMGLAKKERTVSAVWGVGLGTPALPHSINGMLLEVLGLSSRSALVRLSYQFTNFDDCVEENKARGTKGL